MALPKTAVSAPGKVFLAGGYLVLDRHYTALVFGLSARIHVVVQPLPTSPGVTLSEIIVKSPQFRDAIWEYGYRLTENDGGIAVTQLRASASDSIRRNPFIETALSYALTYISCIIPDRIAPASITILADNDYYSQPSNPNESSSAQTGRFANFNVPIWEAHKTGLGSSAALVTAFTAAVLSHYLPGDVFSITSATGLKKLHNLAQISHCAAQGKVGSGFDIASAVYGSCLYRRFSPSLLESYGDAGSSGFASRLQSLVEESGEACQWDTEIVKSKVAIPKGLRLVMCDVDCGSQTPGMVKQVLAWRKENQEEADKLWSRLQVANESLSAELVRLAESGSHDYGRLRDCITAIRSLIRDMSARSGVPIEPRVQTDLIDACSQLSGVVGGVVPGAGGYDAIVLLIEDRDEVIAELRRFLASYTVSPAEEGESTIGKVRMLDVREEMEGVKLEDLATYQEWLA